MGDAGGGDFRAVLGFGEYEGALDGGLGVEGEAFGGPVGMHPALAEGCLDVMDESCGVARDASIAGVAEGGVGVVDLLDHGSDQAGEVGEIALEDGLAEIDVSEEAVEWVGWTMVGGGGEELAGDFGPVVGGGEGQGFFAVEMVEEAAFGEAGGLADVFNARGGVAFGADDVEGRIKDFGLGFVSCFGRDHGVSTG